MTIPMIDILNLATLFRLDFIGSPVKARRAAGGRLAWMNFFLLYVSLPALLFESWQNAVRGAEQPALPDRDTSAPASAFFLAMLEPADRPSVRESTLGHLPAANGNIGYMGPGWRTAVLGSKCAAPTALIFCCDAIFVFIDAAVDRAHRPRSPVAVRTLGLRWRGRSS
jgi:hypothetical protein